MEGISAQTEAYILDKAQDMGLHLSVEVTVVMGERYPYPAAVALTGRSTTAQRQQINRWPPRRTGHRRGGRDMERVRGLWEKLGKYKYAALVLLLGCGADALA